MDQWDSSPKVWIVGLDSIILTVKHDSMSWHRVARPKELLIIKKIFVAQLVVQPGRFSYIEHLAIVLQELCDLNQQYLST